MALKAYEHYSDKKYKVSYLEATSSLVLFLNKYKTYYDIVKVKLAIECLE